MADDISKKILIQVEAETDGLKQNVNDLNQTLDNLQQKQTQLTAAGKQNSDAFKELATQVKVAQTAIDSHNKAIEANSKALGSSTATLQQNKESLLSLLQQHENVSKSEGNHTEKIKDLNSQIINLSGTINTQVTSLSKSGQAFDVHKATVNALSTSFDKLKGVSGTFGPSLEEAAKGFESLKSGLDIVKTGFGSVGEAIKTTGFGILVLVLQSVIDYFTKTKEGSKQLKGAISAVGVVVETVNKLFAAIGKIIVNAVTHPVESIKALGNIIKENIINRFRAFSVILDGIIHLDFKKMGDGVIQAFTGVTNATDKTTNGFKAAKTGLQNTVGEMVNAYKEGYDKAGEHVANHENKVKESISRQISDYNRLSKSAQNAYAKQNNQQTTDEESRSGDFIDAGSTFAKTPTLTTPTTLNNVKLRKDPTAEQTKKAMRILELQQVEAYAKQSEGRIAADAMNVLDNSIKQQSAAKIAALEKDKAAELNNNSLTSAQKLAIQQKYQKEEAAVKAKAFKEQQELSIAQAIINGAQAVSKVWADGGLLGAVESGVVIAETAAQIAKIASQKPPAYAKGGLYYQSDGRGGVLPGYSKTDNTNAYLRSGEGVVVSEAMQVPWARNLVSAINVGFGGRNFAISNPGKGYAVGGIFTDGGDANRYYNEPVHDQKNLANTIAYQMINNFPPVYVDVKDVNNQQNILAQTINRVNL